MVVFGSLYWFAGSSRNYEVHPGVTTVAVSGAAKRRAECTSLGPGPKHPEPPLANFSLAAIRRAEAFHAVFFATKHHDD